MGKPKSCCPLEVTQKELDSIITSECVVVREYEGPSGERIAKVVAWGDTEEMEILADRPEIVILTTGYHVVGQRAVQVELLINKDNTA